MDKAHTLLRDAAADLLGKVREVRDAVALLPATDPPLAFEMLEFNLTLSAMVYADAWGKVHGEWCAAGNPTLHPFRYLQFREALKSGMRIEGHYLPNEAVAIESVSPDNDSRLCLMVRSWAAVDQQRLASNLSRWLNRLQAELEAMPAAEARSPQRQTRADPAEIVAAIDAERERTRDTHKMICSRVASRFGYENGQSIERIYRDHKRH